MITCATSAIYCIQLFVSEAEYGYEYFSHIWFGFSVQRVEALPFSSVLSFVVVHQKQSVASYYPLSACGLVWVSKSSCKHVFV